MCVCVCVCVCMCIHMTIILTVSLYVGCKVRFAIFVFCLVALATSGFKYSLT